MPPDTLGGAYARHMKANGLEPDFYNDGEVPRHRMHFLRLRVRQTHDIWHVITGFDTDPIGELGVKSVEVAQTRRPMAAVVASGGLLRFRLHEPEDLGKVLAAVSAGYQMGIQSKLLLAQRWEQHWDRPLAEWRNMLNLSPFHPE